MAGRFEKGQHLFFLMSDGKTQQDSQNKPRYYLNRDRALQYAKGASVIVEYAPVQYGTWDAVNGTKTRRECSFCGWDVPEYGKFYAYCPNCGAKMR